MSKVTKLYFPGYFGGDLIDYLIDSKQLYRLHTTHEGTEIQIIDPYERLNRQQKSAVINQLLADKA